MADVFGKNRKLSLRFFIVLEQIRQLFFEIKGSIFSQFSQYGLSQKFAISFPQNMHLKSLGKMYLLRKIEILLKKFLFFDDFSLFFVIFY